MRSGHNQLLLDFAPNWRDCSHEEGFETSAFVPGVVVCSDCDTLVLQYVPEAPEELGYISAQWAWHHRDGKPWTTETKP